MVVGLTGERETFGERDMVIETAARRWRADNRLMAGKGGV